MPACALTPVWNLFPNFLSYSNVPKQHLPTLLSSHVCKRDGDLAMIHAYFLDRYFTGFKLAYASPTVVPDDGTTTDTLLGIFAAGISAPNVETATFAVQAVLSADDSCDPEVRAMGALCAHVCVWMFRRLPCGL